MLLEVIRDVVEHYRSNPRDLVADLIDAAAITLLTVASLYLPSLFG